VTNKIAFIGLGNMGSNMAARLVAAGHDVIAYDTNDDAVQRFVAAGGSAAGDARAAAAEAAVILTSLPTPDIVEDVYLGNGGVLDIAQAGAVAVDLSTIDPGTVLRIAEAATKSGIRFLDAPVSGGVPRAVAGTLSVMVGGDEQALDEVRSVLAVLGNTIQYVGPSGTAQLVKLCNNMIAAISCAALGEVMSAGAHAGLSTQTMFDVLSTSTASSHVLTDYFPLVVFGPTRPAAFALDLMVKDIDLFMRAMTPGPVPLLMSSVARQVFRACQGMNMGQRDTTAVVEFFEQAAGVRLSLADMR
jgi:3-hydroxyisobutyrate dehydrogenase-like beta-hydroxyacid dehydrogenase